MPRLSALLLLVLGGFTAGGPQAVAKDEIPFAEKLAEQGYPDLAQDICAAVAADPASPPEVRASIRLVQARLHRTMADAEPDPTRKDQCLERAVRDLEEYLRADPDSAQARTAELRIAEVQQARAQPLLAALKTEPERKRRDALVAVAAPILQHAADLLQKLIEKLRPVHGAEQDLMHARYLACVGRCLDVDLLLDDPARQAAAARQAIAAIDDMHWNYEEDFAFLYDLWIYKGLACQCLKDYDKAMESFRSAARICTLVQDSPASRDPYVVRIVGRAHALGAACANEAQMHKEAIDSVEQLFLRYPSLRDEPVGLAARIEKGKAQAACGLTADALKTLQEVVAVGGSAGAEAGGLIQRLGGQSGADFPPEVYLSLADSALHEGDYAGAVRNALLARGAAHGGEAASRWVPLALQRIGAGYLRMDRLHEAAVAFDEIARRYPASAYASRAAFEAARCWSAVAGASAAPGDEAQFDGAVDLLAKSFPDSPEARNAQFLRALHRENQAQRDPAGLLAAADEYAQVAPAAGWLYDQSLARIGACLFRHACATYTESIRSAPDEAARKAASEAALRELERAAASCLACLQRPAPDAEADPDSARERRELRFGCMDCLARIWLHPVEHAEARILDLFKNIHIEYADDPEKIVKAWTFMIEAELAQGKVAEAAQRLAEMFDRCAEAGRLFAAARDLAGSFDRCADRLTATDPAAAAEARRQAARARAEWLALSRKRETTIPLPDLAGAADRLHAAATSLRDEEAGRAALAALRLLQERMAAGATLAVDGWRLDWKRAECLLVVGEFAEARILLQKLCADHPEPAILSLELAEAEAAFADRGEAGAREQALTLAAGALEKIESGTPDWWRAHMLLGGLRFDAGRYEDLATQIRTLRLAYPAFDEGRWGAQRAFFSLEQKLTEKGVATRR